MRLGALLLQPVMPNRTLIVLETLNAEHTSLAWGQLKPGSELKEHPPLFPRIEVNT
jgi:methionyl-tRNA synthetase